MDDFEVYVAQEKDAAAVMHLSGSLNSLTVARLEDTVSFLYQKGCKRLVLSCECLNDVHSAGMRALLGIARKLRLRSGANGLSLCAVNPDIQRILDLSGLLRCVVVYDDVAQARRGLGIEEG